jgi:Golgi phosphoprotein 3
MDLSLPEEFILLTFSEKKGRSNINTNYLKYGIAGSILLELAHSGKIILKNKRIIPNTYKRERNSILEESFRKIRESRNNKKIKSWIQILSFRYIRIRKNFLKKLTLKGITRKEEFRFFGLFPYYTYSVINSRIRKYLIEEIRGILLENKPLNNRSAVLLGLVWACKIVKKIFPDQKERKVAEKKLTELIRSNDHNKIMTVTAFEITRAISALVL